MAPRRTLCAAPKSSRDCAAAVTEATQGASGDDARDVAHEDEDQQHNTDNAKDEERLGTVGGLGGWCPVASAVGGSGVRWSVTRLDAAPRF